MITVENASFRYADDWVFKDISLEVGPGRTAAILGPNGRGKTTLLKTIIGLIAPNAGRVAVEGRTGYVAQRAEVVFSYSVLDIVVMGRAAEIGMFSAPGDKDFQAARRALDRLGAGHMADRTFNLLSGGERQIVMIARALAAECSVLVLDEPTSALDFNNQSLILSTLKRIAEEDGLAVLLTTHTPQHAAHLADHVLMMYGPDEYFWGEASEALTEDNLEKLYGVPVKALEAEHAGRKTTVLAPFLA